MADHLTRPECECNSSLPGFFSLGLAGHGQVLSATEKDGGAIKERPVTPGDLAAMLYQHMGVPLDATYTDTSGTLDFRSRYSDRNALSILDTVSSITSQTLHFPGHFVQAPTKTSITFIFK
jgi:hypothetical protein